MLSFTQGCRGAHAALPTVLLCWCALQEAAKDSNASLLRLSTEALLVEGLSSLVSAAAGFIPSPGREEDVHALLHALIDAFSRYPSLALS